MAPSSITLLFFVLSSTSFSHPRATRSHSFASYSRWRIAWLSGGPRSCLEPSPRTNWQSSRKRSQPKSIMETGTPGMISLRTWKEMGAFMLRAWMAIIFDLGIVKEWCLLLCFCVGELLILLGKCGSPLHRPYPVWDLWVKEMTDNQGRWDFAAKQDWKGQGIWSHIFWGLHQSQFLFQQWILNQHQTHSVFLFMCPNWDHGV